MFKSARSLRFSGLGCTLLTCMLTLLGGGSAQAATTTLADTPIYSASSVPANLMLALSVEFPTGLVAAYKGTNDYASATNYLGYFDNDKCYDYDSTNGWFVPVNKSGPSCSGHWSGNMLNWATMAALDEFRQALTGGNRGSPTLGGADTTTNTVLLRSNLTKQGSYSTNFPDKNVTRATTIGDSAFSSSTVYIRNGGLGTKFQVADNSGFSNSGGNIMKTYNAQVQVCVANLLESNCNSAHASTDYVGAGVYAKPEGLIQQNYTKIRVGASGYGYLLGNTSGQANGVVRALLRDNGPTAYNGNSARINPNPNAEWSSTTGIFVANPDTADITGTAPGGGNATQTGAINYLNQFGYTNSGYETYDTVSDLYWATLAYFMQVPLDKSYTKNLSATNSLDPQFPVFSGTPPNDPISYSCQANAIVTIGDDHTHYDTGVPGGTINSSQVGGGLPIIPANGTVPAVNAAAYTTALGNLPLIEGTTPSKSYSQYWSNVSSPSLGTQLGGLVWGDQATYYMPGLAYYAHTNDIRNDVVLTVPTAQSQATLGKQTIDTYAVDVLEPGSYDGTSGHEIYSPTNLGSAGPNIYWLTAKYGGFNDINGDGKPANFLTWHTNSTTAALKNLRPDNFFQGNQPDLLQAGLAQIFNRVASTSVARGAAPSVTPTRALTSITANTAPYNSPVAGFPIYNVQYKPVSWDGDVSGFVASALAGGSVTPVAGSNTWSAQAQLENLTQNVGSSGTTIVGWNTGRRVLTWSGTAGVPFRYTSLSTAEQAATGSASLVNFLRGDKSNEGVTYHVRSHVLGDIVDSQAVLVQNASSPTYTEAANPGYTAFSTSIANRLPVVYAGADDGMLHAFQADFSSPSGTVPVNGGGSELFAYVPSLLYNGPSTASTPQVDGLAALANLTGVSTNPWNHHFYVDSTPQVSDIDFQLTGLNPTTSTTATANWQTILVGGLGKGGKGIYALNITTVPSAIATTGSDSTTLANGETKLAQSKVMWEFSDPDMGYSYGRPLIVKTRKYGWVVIMTSGYNNTTGTLAGHGILYVLNAKTGALIQKIDTNVGTATSPAGLAQATGYTQDVSDGTIDQVYAGDLLGNVWRFDLSEPAVDALGSPTPAYPAPLQLATLTDPSGVAQPITTAPRIELSIDSTGLNTLRWVFVGTGQFLDISDLNNSQQQTMYALRDGTGSTPTPATVALTRSVLTANPLTTPLNLSDGATGWYYDLPGKVSSSGGTERIVVNPDAAAGVSVVAWATVTPSLDPCSLQGNIYAADFSTGQSVLQDSAGNLMVSVATASATTGVQMVQLPGGEYAILYGQTGSLPSMAKIKQPGGSNQLNRVNWREILK
ncbi:MAG: PilC/PilY family type IV pilus protein [Pseudoxanthomonas sp.]